MKSQERKDFENIVLSGELLSRIQWCDKPDYRQHLWGEITLCLTRCLRIASKYSSKLVYFTGIDKLDTEESCFDFVQSIGRCLSLLTWEKNKNARQELWNYIKRYVEAARSVAIRSYGL